MILANLARAIRKQNYYAVFLEFVIVIAGVVIGFQINAWNEDRQDRNRAANYLVRIESDLARSVEPQRSAENFLRQRHEIAARLSASILDGSIAEMSVTEVESSLFALGPFQSATLVDTALNDLFESGDIALIEPVSLRDDLSSFWSGFGEASLGNRNIGNMQLENLRTLDGLLSYGWVDGQRHLLTAPVDMAGDTELAAAVERIAWSYNILHYMQESVTRETSEMRERLSAHVGSSGGAP